MEGKSLLAWALERKGYSGQTVQADAHYPLPELSFPGHSQVDS